MIILISAYIVIGIIASMLVAKFEFDQKNNAGENIVIGLCGALWPMLLVGVAAYLIGRLSSYIVNRFMGG